ncbi:GNAT family N-acetyltransferase [Cohnella xylanilytica]|nr:GNAT family N-acetyltransferase [Cohnella xylanilytica]
MAMAIYAETSRLRLRDWSDADLEPFARMNADAEVMRYFPATMSGEATRAFYESILRDFREDGFGFYAAEEKESGEFIGFIGLRRVTFEADFTPCVEIGWRLRRESWGRGYATEGAEACLELGFGELGLPEIYSFTAEVNQPSWNVMRKIGMSFVGTFDHPRVSADSPLCKHVLYRIGKPAL